MGFELTTSEQITVALPTELQGQMGDGNLLSGQALLITPSLMCSFAANYHLNFPRPASIWPCSSVGRATVICSGGRGFEPHRGQRSTRQTNPGRTRCRRDLAPRARSLVIWPSPGRDPQGSRPPLGISPPFRDLAPPKV